MSLDYCWKTVENQDFKNFSGYVLTPEEALLVEEAEKMVALGISNKFQQVEKGFIDPLTCEII